jgi:hypothetical protein
LASTLPVKERRDRSSTGSGSRPRRRRRARPRGAGGKIRRRGTRGTGAEKSSAHSCESTPHRPLRFGTYSQLGRAAAPAGGRTVCPSPGDRQLGRIGLRLAHPSLWFLLGRLDERLVRTSLRPFRNAASVHIRSASPRMGVSPYDILAGDGARTLARLRSGHARPERPRLPRPLEDPLATRGTPQSGRRRIVPGLPQLPSTARSFFGWPCLRRSPHGPAAGTGCA